MSDMTTNMDEQTTCSFNSSLNYALESQLSSLPSYLLHGSTINGNVSIRLITNPTSNQEKYKRELGNEIVTVNIIISFTK